MITVIVETNRILVSGHARAGPVGQDIVCAAVSALTLTLCEGLEAIAEINPEIREEDGLIEITWEDPGKVGKALIDTWFIGISRIRDSYENTITIV